MSNERPILEYQSPSKSRRLRLGFGLTAAASVVLGCVILGFSADGWVVYIYSYYFSHYEFWVGKPLYDHGMDYQVDPLWLFAYTLILPLIWVKRKLIPFSRSIKTKN